MTKVRALYCSCHICSWITQADRALPRLDLIRYPVLSASRSRQHAEPDTKVNEGDWGDSSVPAVATHTSRQASVARCMASEADVVGAISPSPALSALLNRHLEIDVHDTTGVVVQSASAISASGPTSQIEAADLTTVTFLPAGPGLFFPVYMVSALDSSPLTYMAIWAVFPLWSWRLGVVAHLGIDHPLACHSHGRGSTSGPHSAPRPPG